MIKAISKGYQVTIPAEWRNELKLGIGSKIDIEKKNNTITIKPMGEITFEDVYKESKKFKRHNF